MNMKNLPKLGAVIVVIAILGAALYCYLDYQKYHPTTNNAYLQANTINIAAQVSGPIVELSVQDNQHVTKGQLLFKIDPRPFIIALDKAQANLLNTQQGVEAETDAVKTADALIKQRESELLLTQKNAARTLTLVKQKLAPIAEGDQARSKLQVAEAALISAKEQLAQAKAQLGDPSSANAKIKAATADLAQAKLNLQYTHVYAPADGYITNFALRIGTMIDAQKPQFTLVEDNTWWVAANFKETDMQYIKPNQFAEVEVDMYPNHTFKGIVESISRGSGASFALLPPENATGNWVKVTQRFEIRINLPNPNPDYPLRVGSSTWVKIYTQ